MSKVGQAFGGGKQKKPSTFSIFMALKEKAEAEAAAKREADQPSGAPGSPGNPTSTPTISPSEKKFEAGRKKKASRLKRGGPGPGTPGGTTDDTVIKRPGARTATLLGN